MEVILLEDVDGMGAPGDRINVSPGYARNYLLPLGYAVPVTKANREEIEAAREMVPLPAAELFLAGGETFVRLGRPEELQAAVRRAHVADVALADVGPEDQGDVAPVGGRSDEEVAALAGDGN